MRTLFAVLALSLVVLAPPAFADPPPLAPVVAAQPAAPAPVMLSQDQFAALIHAAQAPVAPAVVTTATTTTTSSPAVISSDGVLGFSWSQIVGLILSAAAAILGAVKGGAYLGIFLRSRKVLCDAISAAYWITEKDFADLDSAGKARHAMGVLYQILAGSEIPLTPGIGAQAATAWAAMAAQPVAPAVHPAVLAAATAAAQVAAEPGTATALADKAAK
jgi:hypothetical protein